MNTRKGSRSRLADVLADIKKHDDDNDVTPPPPKRRAAASHHNEPKTNLASAAAIITSPTYVLKLFDRSIQFSGDEIRENIPLYSLVRSWVHGQAASKQKDLKTKPEEPAESTSQLESLHSLPPPKSKAEINKRFNIYPTEEDADIRIPPWVKNFKRPDDVETTIDNSIDTISPAECMAMNKTRWKKVKDDWTLARRYHEARYEESFKTLHDMYSSCEK